MRELKSHVDPRAPFVRRLRKRIAIVTGFATGVALTLGLVRLLPVHEPAIVELQPLVLTLPTPTPVPIATPAPPPAPAPEPNPLACPVLDDSDEPAIGATVRIADIPLDGNEPATHVGVVAARDAPHIAILGDTRVRVSADDGKTFHRAFEDHEVEQIAIDRQGILYALAGSSLGVRTLDGRERWHEPAVAKCEDDECKNRIAVVGDELFWLYAEQLFASRDRGRTWKKITTDDQSWGYSADGQLLQWRGALYQIEHYQDMCGVDDSPVWRLSTANKISHTIFHEYYTSDGPVIQPTDDVGTSWTWRERCGRTTDDNERAFGACTERDADRTAMLLAKTLRPSEGARTLAVHEGGLVELCGDGARQIYRRFPFSRVDAVDSRGRALVGFDHALYRWSAKHGWRRLYRLAKPATESE